MVIEKLPEFAKNGQKNTEQLNLEDGFQVNLKPARQWFNFLFNKLSLSINQIIDEKVNVKQSFLDAYGSDVPLYQEPPATKVLFNSLNDLPIGTRLIVSKSSILDGPNFDSNFLYVETKCSFNNLNGGRLQVAYGYDTGEIAVRSASLKNPYSAWKLSAHTNGNIASASKLQAVRTVSFSEAATGSFSYDGSSNSTCALTLVNSGVNAGIYGSALRIPLVTVNQKGLVTAMSETAIPVGFKKNELLSASDAQLTSHQNIKNFAVDYYGRSVPFFDNGNKGFIGEFAAGYSISLTGGGSFAIAGSVATGRVHGMTMPVGRTEEIKTFEFYTSLSKQFSGNAESATKLQTERKIFGQTFDGSNDVNGDLISNTGVVGGPTVKYHHIDLGRDGSDRMNFTSHGGVFNFIDPVKSTAIATINSSGFSGNSISATKLQNIRTINDVGFDGTGNINVHPFAEPIYGNVDLNNYKKAGFYFCPLDSYAATIVNIPSRFAFSLLVEQHAGIKQTFTIYLTDQPRIWIRNLYANTWGGWKEIAYTSTNVDTASKLNIGRKINEVVFDGTQDIQLEAPLRLNGTLTTIEQVNKAFVDGKYFIHNISIAGIYTYGFLVVLRSGGTCHQIYYPHASSGINNATMAMRQTWNAEDINSWSEWRIVGTRDDSKLPLSGGVVSGNLNVNGALNTGKIWGNEDLWIATENNQKARRVLTGGVLVSDGYIDASKVPLNGIYSKGKILTEETITINMPHDARAFKKLIQAETTTDSGYLAVGNNGPDQGYVELGTTDDLGTWIYATQRGLSGEVARRVTLLDPNGNTIIPQAIYAPKFFGVLAGNASSASKLQTPRQIQLIGAINGAVSFDGTSDVRINTSLNDFYFEKARNGYMQLGNELLLQWGTIDIEQPGEEPQEYRFPISFPNTCLNVSLTRKMINVSGDGAAAGDGGILLIDHNRINFKVSLQIFNNKYSWAVRGFTFMAIGY